MAMQTAQFTAKRDTGINWFSQDILDKVTDGDLLGSTGEFYVDIGSSINNWWAPEGGVPGVGTSPIGNADDVTAAVTVLRAAGGDVEFEVASDDTGPSHLASGTSFVVTKPQMDHLKKVLHPEVFFAVALDEEGLWLFGVGDID